MKVQLMNMPYTWPFAPNLGLSLLQAELRRRGVDCRIAYPNIDLFERNPAAGKAVCGWLCHMQFGDWLFSGRDLESEAYLARIRAKWPDRLEEGLKAVPEIEPFLERTLEAAAPYDVIGFSLMFQQTMASVEMARRIKRRWAEKTVVFGGALCFGPMGREMLRRFPEVDFVFTGEADLTFPEWVERRRDGREFGDLPGIEYRLPDGTAASTGEAGPVEDLDSLPYPDYSDFPDHRALYFESSRGCWWGQKHQCTFCGLNGAGIGYRKKSAPRVVEEIRSLSESKPGVQILQAADNIIPQDYFKTVLPRVEWGELNTVMVWETKGNLKREHMEALARARVENFQPGVESLSNRVLGLIRKGITTIQVAQMLRWAKEFGVYAHWNILYGFPGETLEDYEESARVARLLSHLQAPAYVGSIRLDRFSPNFNEAAARGFQNVRPSWFYAHIYPFAADGIATSFDYDYESGRAIDSHAGPVVQAVEEWKAKPGDLRLMYEGSGAVIVDTRLGRDERWRRLDGGELRAYEQCLSIQTRGAVRCGDVFLEGMEKEGFMMRQGGQWLSLALVSGAWC